MPCTKICTNKLLVSSHEIVQLPFKEPSCCSEYRHFFYCSVAGQPHRNIYIAASVSHGHGLHGKIEGGVLPYELFMRVVSF